MQEAWLKQHKISKEELEAMSPEERQKILDQMKKDIEEMLKRNTENNAAKKVDISV